MRIIKSYLPCFSGFYNTIFEYDNEDSDIENYNEENGTDLSFDDFEFDYEDYSKRISKACVDEIETYLQGDDFKIKLEFEQLKSPREYNFATDEIQVTYILGQREFTKFTDYLEDNIEAFKEYIKKRYTSRSGFSSFYSNDANDWITDFKVATDDELSHTFGTLLEFYFDNEGYSDEDLSEAVSYENYCDFDILTSA